MRLQVPLKSWLEELIKLDTQLECLTLSNLEWKQLKYLIIVLRPFAMFTSLIGSTKDTTINHTWNIYNSLFDHLEETKVKLSKKEALHPWISPFLTAIDSGSGMLSKYYSKTGGATEFQYAFAGMLDPSQKADIFKSSNWTTAMRRNYEQAFNKYWKANYADIDQPSSIERSSSPPIQSLNSMFRLNRDTPGVRAAKSYKDTEAYSYLQSPITTDPNMSVLSL